MTDTPVISPNGTRITARSTRAVLNLLIYNHGGMCRRDFASLDIYEPAARIVELKRAGYTITTRPCERHNHRSRIVEYRLGSS